MQSYKNLLIVLKKADVSNDIALDGISKIIPFNWFLLKDDPVSVKFCYFYSGIKFNGHNPKVELNFTSENEILIEIDGNPIELKRFFVFQTR